MANCYVVQITPLSSSTHADRPPVRYLASIDDNEYAPFEIELLGPYDLTTRPPLEKLLWVALECPRLDEGWAPTRQ